jgi:hypothetical protein
MILPIFTNKYIRPQNEAKHVSEGFYFEDFAAGDRGSPWDVGAAP